MSRALPSWRMAGRSAPAPRTLSPAATAAAHRRGRWGLPTRRRYRIWSLGSTVSLCQLWLHFHLRCQPWVHSPFTLPTLAPVSLHSPFTLPITFASLITFTSRCQPWLHFHLTLPTLAPLSLHFTLASHLSAFRATLLVGKSPPRAGSGLRL